MNVETVVTGVLIGVITGGITAFVGLLFALRQFRKQRAFDKQLEWSERTIRALSGVSHGYEQFRRMISLGPQHEVVRTAQRNLLASIADLKRCTFEAILYGDQKSYEQLQRLYEKSESRVANKAEPEADKAALEADDPPLMELINEVALAISKPTRKMLGLHVISLLNREI